MAFEPEYPNVKTRTSYNVEEHLTNYELSNLIDDCLRLYNDKLTELAKVKIDLAEAEINLDSFVCLVTKEEESKETSKAALNSIVKGDERVLQAKLAMKTLKASKDSLMASLKYLKMKYDSYKKQMDNNNTDKRYIGG